MSDSTNLPDLPVTTNPDYRWGSFDRPRTAHHNTYLQIEGMRWGRAYIGTAAGYAMEYGEDPVQAVRRAIVSKFETVWCSAEAAVISASPLPEQVRLKVAIGDHLRIEGRIFRLDKPGYMDGDNPRLVDVTPPEVAALLSPACTVRHSLGPRRPELTGSWPSNTQP